MSYRTWTTYGFGFCVDDISRDVSLTLEKVLNLAKIKPSVYKAVIEYLDWICERDEIAREELCIDDIDDLEGDFCERGISYILYNVINEELPVIFADNFEGDPYILYCPSYPWNLEDKEKNLTENDVVNVFNKYISILTDIPVNIDYQSVENGG